MNATPKGLPRSRHGSSELSMGYRLWKSLNLWTMTAGRCSFGHDHVTFGRDLWRDMTERAEHRDTICAGSRLGVEIR